MKHLLLSEITPASLGFAMPAEWSPHAATWMSWPADDELWFGHLDAVRGEFAELVSTIARYENVQLLVRNEESETDARARLTATNVKFHRVPLDDVWIRDNGPIFIISEDVSPKGQPTVNHQPFTSFINWKFNAWGGKFDWANDDRVPEYVAGALNAAHWDVPIVLEGGGLEVNGKGVGLTTRSCFLAETRNTGMTEEDYAALLKETLSLSKVLWLGGGLENDHTDGHIDTITRFTDERTIVSSTESDIHDPNHAVLAKNLADLQAMTDQDGKPFRVVELPLPTNYLEGAEGRLPPTYANFYIGNGFVVVPQYGDPNDQNALEVLKPLFPDRDVIGLPSRSIIEGGGSFHCITQQQPAGTIWKGE